MNNYEAPVLMLEEVNAKDVITNSELNETPHVFANFDF